jgi:enediyne polyketide synthase
MTAPIVVVSWACRYPDAATPAELWRNVVEGRRSFRPLPRERLDLARYTAQAVGEDDSITPVRAGLLTDWSFDCGRFRIPQRTYASVDPAHWLALQVAADAVARVGRASVLPRARTGVFVANTLTGDYSRAQALRLRLPFLDDLLDASLREVGCGKDEAAAVRRRFAEGLRACCRAPNEEMLAGGLANTIAGRIANYFDLHGGAYLVDAACASSLVAVADAAGLIAAGDLDAAVVAAVDVSLDPFELVGFSRNGALARDEMRVFDARSEGFWPGEGAAAAVLMRADIALALGVAAPIVLRGWGVATDGQGGLTRPTVAGQLRALRHASERAAVDPTEIGYVEAHGTGTPVGDPIEVRALAEWRGPAPSVLPIGSIKANIGHTKAAAGFAGLIKVFEALGHESIPPHVGCSQPHRVFEEVGSVAPALRSRAWRAEAPLLAGVSAFGFGGVNAHLTVERPVSGRRARSLVLPHNQGPVTDASVYIFSGERPDEVVREIDELSHALEWLSLAELRDVAATQSRRPSRSWRVAIIAENPTELAVRLSAAKSLMDGATTTGGPGVFAGRARHVRIGLLFPGQGAPLAKTRSWCDDFVDAASGGTWSGDVDTRLVQPRVVELSLGTLRLLRACGIAGDAAVGHSLGELTALAWAGALDEGALPSLVEARADAMAGGGGDPGGMVRVSCGVTEARALAEGLPLVVACLNDAEETVLSGRKDAIETLRRRAAAGRIRATPLPVSHAFHSPSMAPAARQFETVLAGLGPLPPVRKQVFSTVTGEELTADVDLRHHLVEQMERTVLFDSALKAIVGVTDLLIEVGPGGSLSEFARGRGAAAYPTRADGSSLTPLLTALCAAFAAGTHVDFSPLVNARPVRDVDLRRRPTFLSSPCAIAPGRDEIGGTQSTVLAPNDTPCPACVTADGGDLEARVLAYVAGDLGMEVGTLDVGHRFLSDLHYNSLAVSRLVSRAAKAHGLQVPATPSDFADATVSELVRVLCAQPSADAGAAETVLVSGVRDWIRTYQVAWREPPARGTAGPPIAWQVACVHGKLPITSIGPLDSEAARGVLVFVGEGADERDCGELVAACLCAWRDGARHLAICHAGAPVSAFARSLAMESVFSTIRVIERPPGGDLDASVAAELSRPVAGFSEVRLRDDGARLTPVFVTAEPDHIDRPLTARDVVLVTGGGSGIGAECAIRLARATGAALALVGRSTRETPQVHATLGRLAEQGLRGDYWQADVSDIGRLREVAAAVTARFGEITTAIHAAGVNDPKVFTSLVESDIDEALLAKAAGLRALVAAAGANLRRVIAFGSIIGRTGLAGEAHYALANAWQTEILRQLGEQDRALSWLSLEWSIWDAVGMGARIGTIEQLARAGVAALPVDAALHVFLDLASSGATGAHIVTGRFGPPPFVSLGEPELPSLRFLDVPVMHYPGVELIVETEVGLGRDPYLADHRLDGLCVLPAVMALEAMAQAASALGGSAVLAAIDDVEFLSAIVVPDSGSIRIRVAVLVDGGRLEAVIRCEDDGFATIRARAVFGCRSERAAPAIDIPPGLPETVTARRLYGPLFFQGPRLQRLGSYSSISTRALAADVLPAAPIPWFGNYEPPTLLLGDAAARDTMLHALQAAVPHRRVVPVSVKRIDFVGDAPVVSVKAIERHATANRFVFDIEACAADGSPVEIWRGAVFQAVGDLDIDAVLSAAPALAATYVERVVRCFGDPTAHVALTTTPGECREERRHRVMNGIAAGRLVSRRGDGRPELVVTSDPPQSVSLAHRDGVSLAGRASGRLGCDLESIAALEPHLGWPECPGLERLREALVGIGQPEVTRRARAWTGFEALRKIGQRPAAEWTAHDLRAGVQRLSNASQHIITVGPLPLHGQEFMVAVAVERPFLDPATGDGGYRDQF